jgi:hypothetical protein
MLLLFAAAHRSACNSGTGQEFRKPGGIRAYWHGRIAHRSDERHAQANILRTESGQRA